MNSEQGAAIDLLNEQMIAHDAEIKANTAKNAEQDNTIATNQEINVEWNETQDAAIQANADKNVEQDAAIQANADKNAEHDTGIEELRHSVETLNLLVDNGGNHKAISYNAEEGYNVCGFPLIAYGHGVPSPETLPEQKGIPQFIGQMYINVDASSNGLYYASGTNGVDNWKNA